MKTFIFNKLLKLVKYLVKKYQIEDIEILKRIKKLEKSKKPNISLKACEYYSKKIGCTRTFNGKCEKEQCFTYRLLQELLRDKIRFYERSEAEHELYREINNLETKCKNLQHDNFYFCEAKKLEKTNEFLKYKLNKIKKCCENNDELQGDFNLIDCDKYKLGKHNLSNKILKIIEEYE